MLEPHERLAIFRLIASDRPSTRESLQMAALYAGQVVLAWLILLYGYQYFNAAESQWALVSAALVIQPAMEQSIKTSAVRIAANTVGGGAGILIGWVCGDGVWQILTAMVIVVFLCEVLRLDLGLRTACVSVAIIMLRGEGRVVSTGAQRLFAVVVGCVVGLLVQLLAEMVRKRLGWHGPDFNALPSHSANKTEQNWPPSSQK